MTRSAAGMFSWLRQVQADPKVSSKGFELAFVISQHVNSTSGSAWPTQETLANCIRADIRTVRRLTKELSDNAHLTITPQRRRHLPITYRLGNQERTLVSGLNDMRADTHVRSEENLTGHFTQSDRTFSAIRPDTHVRENQPQEPTSRTMFRQGRDADSSRSPLDEDAKAILFGEGLEYLAAKTNRSPAALRTAVGQMLKLARDDAGHVLAILRQARRDDRADPVAWIMGVLKARQVVTGNTAAGGGASVPVGLALSKRAARA